jgi:hypothetical protein
VVTVIRLLNIQIRPWEYTGRLLTGQAAKDARDRFAAAGAAGPAGPPAGDQAENQLGLGVSSRPCPLPVARRRRQRLTRLSDSARQNFDKESLCQIGSKKTFKFGINRSVAAD